MRLRFIPLVFLIALAFAEVQGQAGQTPRSAPFGLTMGLPRAEVLKLIAPSHAGVQSQIVTETVPVPNARFMTYQVLVSDAIGLCGVTAIGKPIAMNDFGDQLKTEFAALGAQLTTKYGKPSIDADQLKPGSIWNDPNDWATGLEKEERTLMKLWMTPSVSPDLGGIGLFAKAGGRRVGYVMLTYEGQQADVCRAAVTKSEAAGL